MTTNGSIVATVPIVADTAPRVTLVAPGDPGAERRIECRRAVTFIGTREGCKVRLVGANVAPVHVAIINDGAKVFAVDLLSASGTRLNDLKMEYEVLSQGDVLNIASWVFQVAISDPARGEKADAHPFDLEPTPQVVALEHLSTHRILQPTRGICTIGRRKGCDIAISDSTISRVHAMLITYCGHPAIVDLLSKHGTLVNSQPIQFAMLRDCDQIAIGESRFRVRVVGSSVGKPSSNGKAHSEVRLSTAEHKPVADQVDISRVEGSQRWRIADNLEKASRPK